jgi:DnaJ-class molecular chaperone
METACRIFGKSEETLMKMSRRELSRLYRRRARDLHPDQGGKAPQFIKLTEAYKSLQQRKNE